MKNNDASLGVTAGATTSSQSNNVSHEMAYVERLVLEISNPDLREDALRVLSKVSSCYYTIIFQFNI